MSAAQPSAPCGDPKLILNTRGATCGAQPLATNRHRSHTLVRSSDSRPWLERFDGELLLCDAPLLVGLEAIGRLAWLRGVLPGLSYVVSARLELNQMWVDSVPGAETVTSAEVPEIRPTDSDDPQVKSALLEQVDALAIAWAGQDMTEVATRSAASSFVAARHRRAPLLSHRRAVTTAAMPRNAPQRLVTVGAADLALWLTRNQLEPAAAWEVYVATAATVAGEQWRWPVDSSKADFLYWAEEAAEGRL